MSCSLHVIQNISKICSSYVVLKCYVRFHKITLRDSDLVKPSRNIANICNVRSFFLYVGHTNYSSCDVNMNMKNIIIEDGLDFIKLNFVLQFNIRDDMEKEEIVVLLWLCIIIFRKKKDFSNYTFRTTNSWNFNEFDQPLKLIF